MKILVEIDQTKSEIATLPAEEIDRLAGVLKTELRNACDDANLSVDRTSNNGNNIRLIVDSTLSQDALLGCINRVFAHLHQSGIIVLAKPITN